MHLLKLRTLLRTLHTIGSGVIGWALYDNSIRAMTLAQWVVFPALALSGIWMWKQGAIARWLKPRAAPTTGGTNDESSCRVHRGKFRRPDPENTAPVRRAGNGDTAGKPLLDGLHRLSFRQAHLKARSWPSMIRG